MKRTELENLVILGFLKEKPFHGYKIRKKIKESFGYSTGFTPESIYYSLKKLEKGNFLTRKKEKVGARPERETYRITEKGEKHFSELMERNLDELYRPFFNIDIALYFLKHINKRNFLKKISNQERSLREVRVWANREKKKVQFSHSLIFKHIEKVVSSEIEFLEELKETVNIR